MEEQKRLKFMNALARHLDRFGELLPRATIMEPLTEKGIDGYVAALYHLSPEQLQRACDESLKVCTFFPKPAEILKAYSDWLDIQPSSGTAPHYSEPSTTPEERRESQKLLRDCFAALSKSGEPMSGMRYSLEDDVEDAMKYGPHRRENGWRPREESWRRELERDARATKPVAWHAPIALRQPGED
jgi:hypothetical protein